MTTEGNVNHELIGIPTEDGVKNVHPDIVAGWRLEAFDHLRDETSAKSELKNLAEDAEKQTGVKKGVWVKWFKAQYKNETKKTKGLGDTFAALDQTVPAPVN